MTGDVADRQLRLIRDHIEVAYLLATRLPCTQTMLVNLEDLIKDVDFLLRAFAAETEMR